MNVRRVALVGGASLFILYLLYVLSVALLLHFNAPRSWTESAPRVRLSCGGGHSLWPGRIALDDAELVVQDHNMTMRIFAEHIRVNVDLWALLSGTIHIQDATARGGKVWMRHRVKDLSRNQERVDLFPKIAGFERPMQFPPGPKKRGKQRKVVVDHIDAEANELWFLEHRAEGHFRAEGGFSLTDEVVVFPCWMKTKNGKSFVGDKQLSAFETLNLETSLGPFPRRNAKIQEVLSHLSARIETDARLVDLSPIELYLSAPVAVQGNARLSGEMSFDKGQARSGTLELKNVQTNLSLRGLALSLGLEASFSAQGAGKVSAALQLDPLKNQERVALEKLETRVGLSHEDLSQWSFDSLHVLVEKLRTRDPSLWRNVSGSPQAPLVTVHELSGKAHYQSSGHLDASADARLSWFLKKDKSLGIDGHVETLCEPSPEEAGSRVVRCQKFLLRGSPLVFRSGKDESKLPLSVRATHFTVRDHLQRIDSSWSLSGENPKSLALDAVSQNVLAQLGISALPLGSWDATLHLNRDGRTLAGQLARAQIGKVTVKGRFVAARAFTSAWEVETPVGRYGVRQKPQKTQVKPFVSRDWFQSCEAQLSEC